MAEIDEDYSYYLTKYGQKFAGKTVMALGQVEKKIDEILRITDSIALESKKNGETLVDVSDFLSFFAVAIMLLLPQFNKECAIKILNCAIHLVETDEDWDKGKD